MTKLVRKTTWQTHEQKLIRSETILTKTFTCKRLKFISASFCLTAEVGDFPLEEYADHTYLRAHNLHYIPKQTEELEKKIMEYHKQHV